MNEPYASRHITVHHCSNLRHKGMYVTDSYPDEQEAIEATAYWCVCTQKSFGPDGHPVSPGECQTSRGCCEH
jgi:hypothetical protein